MTFKVNNTKNIYLNLSHYQGSLCGQGKLSSQPYLLMFDLTQCLNPTVLLAGCPTPQVKQISENQDLSLDILGVCWEMPRGRLYSTWKC